jgi:uncharacterized SAM-binding protein YcdF (DUF218 family)
MGRLLKFILQLFLTLFIVTLFTTAWVVFDGLNDLGQKSDAVLVTNSSSEEATLTEMEPRLEKAAKLYRNGDTSFVIIGGGASEGKWVDYLAQKGVPSSAILKLPTSAENTEQVATQTAALLKDNDLHSVMVITEYYHMTRAKLALNHEGVTSVEKDHVGELKKEDAEQIGREIIGIYDYVGRMYIIPTAEDLFSKAKTEGSKAASDAKKDVDNGLDKMSK